MNASGKLLVPLLLLFALVVFSRPPPVHVASPAQPQVTPQPKLETLGERLRGLEVRLHAAERLEEDLRSHEETLQHALLSTKVSARQLLVAMQGMDDRLRKRQDELRSKAAQATEREVLALLKNAEDFRKDMERARRDREDQLRLVDRVTADIRRQASALQRTQTLRKSVERELPKLREAIQAIRRRRPSLAEGAVLAIRDDHTMEVSVGANLGVRKATLLEVTREVAGRVVLVQRLEVLEFSPENALCKVYGISSVYAVREGDRVIIPAEALPETPTYGRVDGTVTAVQGTGLIEISIGSDDGLNKGAWLRVFRADGSMYLGRAQVLRTAPDKSVCVVLPETRKGVITKGDRVSSGVDDR